MKWLCQIKKNESNSGSAYHLILLRIISLGVGYCDIKGDHLEFTVSIGPVGFSFGMSVWRYLLP